MFRKKLTLTCILALTISLVTVNAHQGPDPGPNVIKGNRINLRGTQNGYMGYDEKIWEIKDLAIDSQDNAMLGSVVELRKQLYNPLSPPLMTGGTAIAKVAAAPFVSWGVTKGRYYVKAKGRGKYWYRSQKLSGRYSNGVYRTVSKIATRKSDNPTWSGVHLWGKAEVDNQFRATAVTLEWL